MQTESQWQPRRRVWLRRSGWKTERARSWQPRQINASFVDFDFILDARSHGRLRELAPCDARFARDGGICPHDRKMLWGQQDAVQRIDAEAPNGPADGTRKS